MNLHNLVDFMMGLFLPINIVIDYYSWKEYNTWRKIRSISVIIMLSLVILIDYYMQYFSILMTLYLISVVIFVSSFALAIIRDKKEWNQ
jgi:hypothetical protein